MLVRPVVALIALALLGACGEDGADAPESTTTTSNPTAEPSMEPTAVGVVLTGVVGAGDEGSCLTLTTTGSSRKTWQLVGSTAQITVGDRVTLRGSPAPDLATRCQQGTPFVVETVEPG